MKLPLVPVVKVINKVVKVGFAVIGLPLCICKEHTRLASILEVVEVNPAVMYQVAMYQKDNSYLQFPNMEC